MGNKYGLSPNGYLLNRIFAKKGGHPKLDTVGTTQARLRSEAMEYMSEFDDLVVPMEPIEKPAALQNVVSDVRKAKFEVTHVRLCVTFSGRVLIPNSKTKKGFKNIPQIEIHRKDLRFTNAQYVRTQSVKVQLFSKNFLVHGCSSFDPCFQARMAYRIITYLRRINVLSADSFFKGVTPCFCKATAFLQEPGSHWKVNKETLASVLKKAVGKIEVLPDRAKYAGVQCRVLSIRAERMRTQKGNFDARRELYPKVTFFPTGTAMLTFGIAHKITENLVKQTMKVVSEVITPLSKPTIDFQPVVSDDLAVVDMDQSIPLPPQEGFLEQDPL
jgi:hypothetical protein